jgi:hypothetical protein
MEAIFRTQTPLGDVLAVSRYKCHSDLYEMDLMLDINVSIYPIKVLCQ